MPTSRKRAQSAEADAATFTAVRTVGGAHGLLSNSTLLAIKEAQALRQPLLVRCSLSLEDQRELLAEWTVFVAAHSDVKLQRASKGAMELGTIWKSAERAETGINNFEQAEYNPVRAWLSASRPGSVAHRCWLVQRQLNVLATAHARTMPECSRPVFPSFVAGLIPEGGGPSHYDDYDNLAMVLCGCKTFFVIPYNDLAFVDVVQDEFTDDGLPKPLRGKPNERLDVSPFCNVSRCLPWHSACLSPGDILVVPHRMWHWVHSKPHSVMTNVWVPTPLVRMDIEQPF